LNVNAFSSQLRAALAVAPWLYFLWSGYDLCYGPRATPPNSQQVHLYIVAPAVGAVVGLLLLASAQKTPRWLGWLFFFLQIFALIPIMGLWGGGI
jgi:hypothetical protein